ncbi:unnamed protein product [Arabidopsis halleri]
MHSLISIILKLNLIEFEISSLSTRRDGPMEHHRRHCQHIYILSHHLHRCQHILYFHYPHLFHRQHTIYNNYLHQNYRNHQSSTTFSPNCYNSSPPPPIYHYPMTTN